MSEAPSTPAQSVQQGILQALYALFLGGIITAFLVVGLTTFFPQPSTDARITELESRQAEIFRCPEGIGCELTAAEETEVRQIEQDLEELREEQRADQRAWTRTAGLILIAAATVLLALSLVRWDRAIVLSNGLLLGGLFTMVGGIGMTIAGGEGVARFLVLSLALALTIGLGYLRFARRPAAGPAPGAALPGSGATAPEGGAVPEGALDALSGRVAELESRLAEMRRALGG